MVWSVWALQGTACIIKKRVMKKKKKETLCRCLIQIWCKCKCNSVGRCESNSSQFTCCGPFSVMNIGFLADTILLATKSAGGVKVMQIGNSHVEVSCTRNYLFIHMTIITIMSGNTALLCFQCPPQCPFVMNVTTDNSKLHRVWSMNHDKVAPELLWTRSDSR